MSSVLKGIRLSSPRADSATGQPARFSGQKWQAGALLAGLILLTHLTGCSLLRGPTAGLEFADSELDLDSLAAIVNRRALSLRAVRCSGDLRIRTTDSGKTRKLDISLIAERPDRLRMQGRAGILASIFDFVADRDSLTLYLPRDHVAVTQDVSATEGLPLLASSELVLALLQEPLDVAAVRHGGDFRRVPGGYEVVKWERGEDGGRTTRTLVFESSGLRLLHQKIERESTTGVIRQAEMTYSRHVWTGFQWFPAEVRLELGDAGESLELKFIRIESNPVIAQALFLMDLPKGTRRIDPEELDENFLSDAPEE